MNVIEAIGKIDDLKPNTYSNMEKTDWLTTLDRLVKREIIDVCLPGNDVAVPTYTEADTMTELLVPSPYDEIYIYWLEGKIDYYNHEYSAYNNAAELFNNLFQTYKERFQKEHPQGDADGDGKADGRVRLHHFY
jgi:hypothetical protein